MYATRERVSLGLRYFLDFIILVLCVCDCHLFEA